MKQIKLADNRTLVYEDSGNSKGLPILFQHGTGDSRLCKFPDDSITKDLKIRLITIDRPSVGGSSPLKGRTILDWVNDIETLTNNLNINTFTVAGHSGGSPHALAIAKVLGNRVTKVGIASPIAPFDEPGTKKLIKDKDLKLIYKFTHFKFLINFFAKSEAKKYTKNISKFVEHCAKVWPSDKVIFTDPVLVPMFEAEFVAAFAQGGIGALDDMWAFLDWGFKPEEVTQKVELFYGDNDDILDPEMSVKLNKRLPNCNAHIWKGAGHYSLYSEKHWQEFLETLIR